MRKGTRRNVRRPRVKASVVLLAHALAIWPTVAIGSLAAEEERLLPERAVVASARANLRFLEAPQASTSEKSAVAEMVRRSLRSQLLILRSKLQRSHSPKEASGVLREVEELLRRIRVPRDGTLAQDVVWRGATSGSISGTVRREDDGTPIAGVGIVLRERDPEGLIFDAVVTSPTGSYGFTNVPDGVYTLRTFNEIGLVDERWEDVPCVPSCYFYEGDSIEVAAGAAIGAVDLSLAQGGGFSGLIAGEADGELLRYFQVDIFDREGAEVLSLSSSVFDWEYPLGFYTIGGLPAGDYYARATGSEEYTQLYNGRDCRAGCSVTDGDVIPVAPGEITDGIDFSLSKGGVVSGTVTDGRTGLVVEGITVDIRAIGDRDLATTSADGRFESRALTPGTYTALAAQYETDYSAEYWDDVPCSGDCSPGGATPIVVDLDASVSDIDFVLAPLAAFSGAFRAGDAPAPGTVHVFDEAGVFVSAYGTSQDGTYRVPGLEPGTYFAISQSRWIDALYDGLTCEDFECDPTAGTPIVLERSEEVPGIDFDLGFGGSISGRVIDEMTGEPVSDALVEVFHTDIFLVDGMRTDFLGRYRTSEPGLLGSYLVRANHSQYEAEEFDGLDCGGYDCADPAGALVEVAAGEEIADIDFTLRPLATISGTIRSNSARRPSVHVYDQDGIPFIGGDVYALSWQTVVPAGDYFAGAGTSPFDFPGLSVLYDGVYCRGCPATEGTLIRLSPGDVRTGVDFDLRGLLFIDGFESGDFREWDSLRP